MLKSFSEAASEGVLYKGVFKNLAKFTGKHLHWSLFFNKNAGLRSESLLKKRLQHRRFPVNFATFLKTSISQNTSGRLLLLLIECHVKHCFRNSLLELLRNKYAPRLIRKFLRKHHAEKCIFVLKSPKGCFFYKLLSSCVKIK